MKNSGYAFLFGYYFHAPDCLWFFRARAPLRVSEGVCGFCIGPRKSHEHRTSCCFRRRADFKLRTFPSRRRTQVTSSKYGRRHPAMDRRWSGDGCARPSRTKATLWVWRQRGSGQRAGMLDYFWWLQRLVCSPCSAQTTGRLVSVFIFTGAAPPHCRRLGVVGEHWW